MDSKQLFTLLAALLLSFASYAQSTVSGVVRSEGDNETIPGVSVLVKGTTRGTVTDLDGKFQVEAAAGEVLSVSYIGYATKEITIQGGQTQYDVTLASSMSDLSEVVVVGYGSQLKKEITGAVQTLDGDDLMDIPATQIGQKLQGQLAGVQINQTTGRPGQGINVRIRGNCLFPQGVIRYM